MSLQSAADVMRDYLIERGWERATDYEREMGGEWWFCPTDDDHAIVYTLGDAYVEQLERDSKRSFVERTKKERRKDMERDEFVIGLRQLADLFESNPALQRPHSEYYVCVSAHSVEELATAARALGSAEKRADEHFFNVWRKFGPIRLVYYIARSNVCAATVVGKKTVKRVKEITPAVTEIVEEEVDVVRWDCPPSLLELIFNEPDDTV